MEKTKYHSWKNNSLTKGCIQCVRGEKLVVFVTGICPKHCFYCPLSEQKKDKDVIFANERKLIDENDTFALIEEAKSCNAKGAGFTGGDPLTRIDRTAKFIKILKETFGKKFHTHLYTVLESFTEDRLKKLDDAGLDEIRFHPDIEIDKCWKKFGLLFDENGKRKYSFRIGVEIPLIPKEKDNTIKLIDYFASRIDFINLNELEISDTNSCKLVDRKYRTKNSLSYGVKGSEELGHEILGYIQKKYPEMNAHYCTCKLKDGVQLKERLKRRANITKKKFDIIGDDGTIIRGAIYIKELIPEFSYKQKIEELHADFKKKDKIIFELNSYREQLINNYDLPTDLIEVDSQKFRIITNVGVVEKLSDELKNIGLIPAIVEQYPTWDQMEVDVEFL